MHWIHLYFFIVSLWLFIVLNLTFFSSTRGFGVSLLLATFIVFSGLKLISMPYFSKMDHREEKRSEFLSIKRSLNEDLSLNITPSAWLTDDDGRGVSALVDIRHRKVIGDYFPLGSAPNVETWYCKEDDGFVRYKTDRYGFRNQESVWDLSYHDIVLLGDSFSESACVQLSMQSYFDRQKTVVSLGKGGNGPLTSLAVFTEYLASFKSGTVFHLVVPNDYSASASRTIKSDLERELLEEALQSYLGESESIIDYFGSLDLTGLRDFSIAYSESLVMDDSVDVDFFISHVANIFSYEFLRSHFLFALRDIYTGSQRFVFPATSDLEEVYKSMTRVANKHDVDLRFVILPSKYAHCTMDSRYLYLKEVFLRLNVTPIDLWTTMCQKRYFADSGIHFSPLGYKSLAGHLEVAAID